MAIGTYISIITLNGNWINAPTKRHRLAKWIQKEGPYICCLQEIHFRPRHIKTESEKMLKYIPSKLEAEKVGVAILIPDKLDLKIKITRDKEEHCIMIKGSIQKEDIIIVNLCTQHRSTSIHKTDTNRHTRRNWQ